MRNDIDYDMPTFIRNGLDPERELDRRWSRYDLGGLVWRCRFQVLFVEFVSRVTCGDIFWR